MSEDISFIYMIEYSKHPRIRTYIFASQPELVLIYWVFSKTSGYLGSKLGSYFFHDSANEYITVFSQTLV